jgi:hypothetical protein
LIVADTTPLSVFLRIGRIDLVQSLVSTLYIPEAVAVELDRGQKFFGQWREQMPFVQVLRLEPSPLLALLKSGLDMGEAEAIALAVERKTELLLIDEAQGRAMARRLSIEVIGSVGLVLLAKERGLVPAVLPVLDDLRARGGLWLSDAFYESIVARTCESTTSKV